MVRNSKSTPSENKDNSSNQDKQDEVSDNKDDKIQDEQYQDSDNEFRGKNHIKLEKRFKEWEELTLLAEIVLNL
ncbi:hypothetical protein C2G38_2118636 [Gigaspora rosea]|uniref:Uncharacterized protein n=1 Tax=Gigaspora rosea TaxID=44941 RepID=A0A397U538_9GLOM|nr:hypothetical protein C2G38_2118636 [Gigaspora rosea]